VQNVLRHEHYEEICAAASIGNAAPEELAELERHATHCESCRETYSSYLQLAAQQFAAADQNPSLSGEDALECLNSELLTHRFLDRAQREGISFSREVHQDARRSAPRPLAARRSSWTKFAWAIAASVLIALSLSGGYLYGVRSKSPRQTVVAKAPEVVHPDMGRIAQLTAENAKLHSQLDDLSAGLKELDIRIASTEANLESTSQERQALTAERDEIKAQRDALQAQLKGVQQDLAKSEAAVASFQQEAANLRDHSRDTEKATEVALADDHARIRDLSEQLASKSAALDQEHQLLAVGHDVTDLMGARNLHIVDVADTDPHGKTRPAFGRVFFTEGKSLIFYAYDLKEAKMEKANYQYRVWAKKEGDDKQVRNLGIFYSDDKAQRRWAFKCTDPKILSEIDSVFVTLEPAGSDPAHPKGQNLMYAYLHGQPNHP
jgi:hypothetical protein